MILREFNLTSLHQKNLVIGDLEPGTQYYLFLKKTGTPTFISDKITIQTQCNCDLSGNNFGANPNRQ